MGNEMNGDFRDVLKQMNEARQIEQEEREIRYAGRKNEKLKHRTNVEQTAAKMIAAIDAELEKEHSPQELAALASALAGTATALHAADNYAEFTPFNSLGIGAI